LRDLGNRAKLTSRAIKDAANSEPTMRDVRPFLANFATPRTGGDEQPGRYCDRSNLWVIDTVSGPRPLIETDDALGQAVTTTKIRTEADDTDVQMGAGLITHTSINTEADDVSPLSSLPDLGTHTYVKTESDDVERLSAGWDLTTTTRVRMEGDDLDHGRASGLAALVTKTDVQTERDDTSVGLELYVPFSGVPIPPLRVH